MEYLEYTKSKSVRQASVADIGRLVELSEEFYKASPYYDKVPWDSGKIKSTIRTIIEYPKGKGTIFVGLDDQEKVQGMLACAGGETFFSSEPVATEIMWWISPSARGLGLAKELVQAYETWCRLHGYRLAQMVLLEPLRGDVLHQYYTRKGYELTEKAYVKVL
jgi:GNAT superfamily N-acetyltransferase